MFKIRLLCFGTMLSLKEVSLSKIRIQGKSAHGEIVLTKACDRLKSCTFLFSIYYFLAHIYFFFYFGSKNGCPIMSNFVMIANELRYF